MTRYGSKVGLHHKACFVSGPGSVRKYCMKTYVRHNDDLNEAAVASDESLTPRLVP
jgi:hypothetical protein